MKIVMIDLADLFAVGLARPPADPSLNPIYEQLGEMGLRDKSSWPLVFDRFDMDLLNKFHDEVLAHAEYYAERGNTGMSIGAMTVHDEVCAYLNAKLKLGDNDHTKRMKANARHN